MLKRTEKEAKKVNEKLDDASRAVGQDVNEATGINVSHVVNPEASDHKEALRNAREKLGIGNSQEKDNTELAGDNDEVELNS
ncbi:hypothetical protein [Rickettsia endosymbiont of Gonocerus acuteangulatus]|uniref:hypothetical protein n=1 Tax=Rickettsia endosymbiont of Gonocerus acuteangulatus TaxID=3066266 RepID=UPI0031330729